MASQVVRLRLLWIHIPGACNPVPYRIAVREETETEYKGVVVAYGNAVWNPYLGPQREVSWPKHFWKPAPLSTLKNPACHIPLPDFHGHFVRCVKVRHTAQGPVWSIHRKHYHVKVVE